MLLIILIDTVSFYCYDYYAAIIYQWNGFQNNYANKLGAFFNEELILRALKNAFDKPVDVSFQ